MTHMFFFNISCHKQSLAFSSHGKGLLDLKNIGDIWVHWNMAAFGHVSWFYDAVPFHPSLLQFHFTPCKKKLVIWSLSIIFGLSKVYVVYSQEL